MANVFIDTELWVYSLKRPDQSRYQDTQRFQLDTDKHLDAKSFFKKLNPDCHYYFTIHQLCEIYHNLRFRGSQLDAAFVNKFMTSLASAPTSTIIEISKEVYERCTQLSQQSNIHIWDFLCIIPLSGKIDLIYTTDKHFQNQYIVDLGIPIRNPLKEWDIL